MMVANNPVIEPAISLALKTRAVLAWSWAAMKAHGKYHQTKPQCLRSVELNHHGSQACLVSNGKCGYPSRSTLNLYHHAPTISYMGYIGHTGEYLEKQLLGYSPREYPYDWYTKYITYIHQKYTYHICTTITYTSKVPQSIYTTV